VVDPVRRRPRLRVRGRRGLRVEREYGLAPGLEEPILAARPTERVPDQSLNNLLASQLGPGWIGEAFVFADAIIGTAQPDGVPSITGIAHSSELVGDLPNLAPDYGLFGNERGAVGGSASA